MSHPETWAKKTRPMWGRRDSMSPPLRDKQYPVPSHWVGEEGLIDTPPPIKGGHGSSPMSPPDKKGGAYCCPPFNLLPLLREDIGAHPMSP